MPPRKRGSQRRRAGVKTPKLSLIAWSKDNLAPPGTTLPGPQSNSWSIYLPALRPDSIISYEVLTMNIPRLSLVAVLSLAACPVLAFNLGDAANALSTASGNNAGDASSMLGNPQSLELLQTLSSLKLTPQQALGGTGALLGLAKNQLPSAEYSQLNQSIPGLEQFEGSKGLDQLNGLSGLLGKSAGAPLSAETTASLGNVNSLPALNQAFSALGMDSGIVGQFAPLLLQYFGQQGVNGSLLNSLASLWGVGSGA